MKRNRRVRGIIIKDDKILVIHQGIIAESGTHTELLAANGIYEKLYKLIIK